MATEYWLLLTYKVPPEPARGRVSLWRKLKSLGAVYLQNGVCLLPRTDEHARALKLIENDISSLGGESVILQAAPLDRHQTEKVVERFRSDRDEEYRELIDRCADFEAEIAKERAADHFSYAEVEENDVDLKKLRGWYAKISGLDFYEASLRTDAASRIEDCEALLEAYANDTFARQDENRSF